MLIKRIRCGFCQIFFRICRRCYRGQIYCCAECRVLGKREKRREAQRRYRKTEKGKKAHREAENRRRQRAKRASAKKMDDASSIPPLILFMILAICVRILFPRFGKSGGMTGRCDFCGTRGKIVREFPRRGYANCGTNNQTRRRT